MKLKDCSSIHFRKTPNERLKNAKAWNRVATGYDIGHFRRGLMPIEN